MLGLLTWEEYNLLHDGINETEFDRAEALAEIEIANVIGRPRLASVDGTEYFVPQLKECIANVIDAKAEQTRVGYGRGITSVTNDGYTESYTNATASQAHEELSANIKIWLSGSGLVGAY